MEQTDFVILRFLCTLQWIAIYFFVEVFDFPKSELGEDTGH